MNSMKKPTALVAADKVNDVVEDLALEAAGIADEPDPEHVAGKTNEQVYLPETEGQPPSAAGQRKPK
jgi:hypothetical protein